jgi:preprotein translocase subunit SecB
MIRLSPLKLQRYFVDELHVTARTLTLTEPTAVPELMPEDLDVNVELFEAREKLADRLCVLSVKLKETSKPFPYNFQIRLTGFFELQLAGMTPQQQETHVRFSMPSLLWAAAREVLITQMEKGPYPAVILPVVTFLPEQEAVGALKGAGTALGAHQVP